MKISNEQLKEILDKHLLWLKSEKCGVRVDLSGADLIGANLNGAYLSNANLRGADLKDAKIDFPIACPEKGDFVGFKKANDCIVELRILSDSKRSSATTRKCRCSKAMVMSITKVDGSECDLKEVCSTYDHSFIYRVGEIVEVNNFDENRWNVCAPGIHFFMSRDEAVNYILY